MAAASDYLEQRVLAFVLNANTEYTWTTTASVYLALYTVDPSDAGGGTECPGTNYARETLTGAFTAMTTVTDGATENIAEIAFPQASDGTWDTIIAVGIFDAITGGNLLFHGGLDVDKLVEANDTFKIAAGDLTVTMA